MKHDWIYLGMNRMDNSNNINDKRKMEVLLLKTYFEATVELNHLWIWISKTQSYKTKLYGERFLLLINTYSYHISYPM
jgi:hypothetical protein